MRRNTFLTIDSRSKIGGIKPSFLMKKFIRRVDKKIFKLCRSFDNLCDKSIGGYWNWLNNGGILTNIKSKKLTYILAPIHILISLITVLSIIPLSASIFIVPVILVYGILNLIGLTGAFEILALIIPIMFFVRYWPQ